MCHLVLVWTPDPQDMQTEKVMVLCNNFGMVCHTAINNWNNFQFQNSGFFLDSPLFIFIHHVSNTEKTGFRYSQSIYSFAQSFDLFA